MSTVLSMHVPRAAAQRTAPGRNSLRRAWLTPPRAAPERGFPFRPAQDSTWPTRTAGFSAAKPGLRGSSGVTFALYCRSFEVLILAPRYRRAAIVPRGRGVGLLASLLLL